MNRNGTNHGFTLYIVDKHGWNIIEPSQNTGKIM
jgi:hypothetical protein